MTWAYIKPSCQSSQFQRMKDYRDNVTMHHVSGTNDATTSSSSSPSNNVVNGTTTTITATPIEHPTTTTQQRPSFLQRCMNAIEEKRVIPMRILFRFATRRDKYLIIAGSICSIGVGVLQTSCLSIFAHSTSEAVAAITRADGSLMERLQPTVIGFAGIGGVLMLLSYSGNALWIIAGENQVQAIRRYYIASLLRQDMQWFDTRTMDHDALTTRLALDMQQLQDGISERFGGLIRSISAFASGFLMALFMGWQVAIVVLPTIPLLAFMAYLTIHLLVHSTYKLQAAYGDAGSVAQQVFDNIRTVYSYSLQHRFTNMYKAHLIKARQAGVHRGLYGGLCYAALVSVLLMTYALALWYAGIVISRGDIDSWNALTAILGMVLGSIAFLQVPGHMSAIAAAYTAARKIFDTIDSIPTIDNPLIARPIPPIQGDIVFRNVTFAYPNRPGTAISYEHARTFLY